MRFPSRRKVPWPHQGVEIWVLGWLCSLSPMVVVMPTREETIVIWQRWYFFFIISMNLLSFSLERCQCWIWKPGISPWFRLHSVSSTVSIAPLRALLLSRMWRMGGKFLHAPVRDLENNCFQQALRGNIPISCHPIAHFPPENVSSSKAERSLRTF